MRWSGEPGERAGEGTIGADPDADGERGAPGERAGEQAVSERDWAPLLAELDRRRTAASVMGGTERLARLAAAGHADARSRVAMILDQGSFVEIGLLAGGVDLPADAFVAGAGTIEGRPVFVGAEDFSVAGGSIGVAGGSKRARLVRLAAQEHAPLVLFLEGAGHRATNALAHPRPAPHDLQALADLSGQVPIVAIVSGPSAGHGALAAPLADCVIMVDGPGALFTAGPPLVAAATGEVVDKQTLGGTAVHAGQSGLVHLVAADQRHATELARRWLGYLAPGCSADVPEGERDLPELYDLIPPNPRTPYDMRAVVDALADAGSVLELQAAYGASMLTALARLGGRPVGIVANQPKVRAGAIDVPAADKAAGFLELCGRSGLPVVLLADTPGLLAGQASERAGILRAGARMYLALRRAPVPKIHVTLRKAFGFGSTVMGMNAFEGQSRSLALPGVVMGGMPAKVGAATAKETDRTRELLVSSEAAGPWRLAETVTYDDVIDPKRLRTEILAGLRIAAGRAGPYA